MLADTGAICESSLSSVVCDNNRRYVMLAGLIHLHRPFYFLSPHAILVLFGVLFFSMCRVVDASPSSGNKSKPAVLPRHPLAWKRAVAQVCGVSMGRVEKIQSYHSKQAGHTKSFALGLVWVDAAKTTSQLVFVSYFRCNIGWCRSSCMYLHEQICSSRSKPSCYAQFRVLRLVDLQDQETIVKPESGSWWESVVVEPKKPTRWPMLLIQHQILRDTGDNQRTEIHTIFLSLQSEQQPRQLMKLLTYERWPPVLTAGRKQDPIGRRVYHLQFQQTAGQPIELTTIERPIPSPFDRCCQPQDTHKRYQLATQGFEVVNDL